MARRRMTRMTRDTRAQLLDAGVRTLIQDGYNGTGIKDVLDVVGVPKGSFYNYFQSKEDFGAAVVRLFSKRTQEQLDAWLENPKGDALSALKAFFEAEAKRHQKEKLGCLVGNLGAELDDGHDVIRSALKEGLQGMKGRFQHTLEQAQKEGTVRKDLSAAELAAFILGGYEGALLRMKIEGSVEPIREFARLTLDKFIRT